MNIYDFDGTIYDGDSSVDFYFFALRKKPSLIRFIPKQLYGFVLYKFKKIDKTALKERFFAFLSEIDAEKLLDEFWDKNEKKIFEYYLKRQSVDDIIISASPEFLLKPICQRLGVKYLIASKVDVKSGKFDGKNCRGSEKVKRLYDELGVDSFDNFYSDSNADLPLARLSKKAYRIVKGNVVDWDIE